MIAPIQFSTLRIIISCTVRYFCLALASLVLTCSAVAQETDWQTIERFSGSSSTQTRPFTIESSEWRARWRYEKKTGQVYASLFQVNLKQPGEDWDGDALASVANQDGHSSTSYHYEPGRFYLDVNTTNVRWHVKIQVPKQ